MRFATALILTAAVAAFAPADDARAPAFPPLPQAVSSFGAVVSDGYLYVYGGHAGETHSYDTKSVLGTFQRLKLSGGTKWEELPAGPIAQGMNLVAHAGKIYRVGGMQPRNAPGEPTDNHSLADCARFDPAKKVWEQLPAMPAGRSSHDVVAVGDKLVVVGGWEMKGKGQKSTFHDTALILDLGTAAPKWEVVPQPFQRRALTAAAVGSKVYVLGGLGAEGKATDVFDVATKTWSTGPTLPLEGKKAMSFSPAAATVNGRVVVNTVSGGVYRLTTNGQAWEKVGQATTPRMVARLVPHDAAALLVGGARMGEGNTPTLELLRIAETGQPVAPPAPKQ
jgi:N-acetylneuraminic acid mutarotase